MLQFCKFDEFSQNGDETLKTTICEKGANGGLRVSVFKVLTALTYCNSFVSPVVNQSCTFQTFVTRPS